MIESALKVPPNVTFQQAIAITHSLVEAIEANKLHPSEILTIVSDLVKTKEGARGFFVSYLTSEKQIADNPPAEIVEALRSNPDTVAELLTKNLAMSTAQALTHVRDGNQNMAKSSERVCERTAILIRLVNLAPVYENCQELLESVATGQGDYQQFLERWVYDTEQKQLITQALQLVLSH